MRRLVVGITTSNLWRGSGTLYVAPGFLACEPAGLAKKLGEARPVRHEGLVVDLFVARLVPPWFNVTIPIRGVDDVMVASRPLWSRKMLRKLLAEAGFQIVEHVTWTDRGFRWRRTS